MNHALVVNQAPLIQIENLTRKAADSGKTLLDDLSITIAAGDRVGLSGESGSGKTTLLRSLARLDPVHKGVFRFQGQPILDLPKFRRNVVYLHQRPAMVDGTVRENLQLPFSLSTSQQAYNEEQIAHWLSAMDKPVAMLDQSVDTLSGGEQQIAALLRAVQVQPAVLLFDEPPASLDAVSTERFEQMVNLWFDSASAQALVWISHDSQQLARMTNRTIRVAGGRIVS